MNRKLVKLLGGVLTAITLAACGGGGGGGGDTTASAPVVPATPSNSNLVSLNTAATTSTVVKFATDGVTDNSSTVAVSGHFGSATAECYITQTTPRNSIIVPAPNWSSLAVPDTPNYIVCVQSDGTVKEVSQQLFGKMYAIQGAYPVVGDLNGDGIDDIALLRQCDCADNTTELHVFLSQANGTYAHQIVPVGSTSEGGLTMHLAAGAQFSIMDINRDGQKDLVGTAGFVFLNDGAGHFNQTQYNDPNTVLNGWQYATATCSGDFAGIGHDQLLIADRGMPDGKMQRNAVFDIDSNLNLISRYELPIPYFSALYGTQTGSHNFACRTADVMKNGKPWIFIYTSNYYATGPALTQVQVYRNDSTNGVIAFTDVTSTALPGFVQAAGPSYEPRIVDVNGDGYPDMLLDGQTYGSGGATSGAQVWINNKDGTFHKAFTTELSDLFAAYKKQYTSSSGAEVDAMLPILVNGKWNYIVELHNSGIGYNDYYLGVANTQYIFK